MNKSIDFDRVARYYDVHVRTELDLAFWVGRVAARAFESLAQLAVEAGELDDARELLRSCAS